MSHFAVMVIGNDPEKQLAPYHEFECTGQDDQYVEDVDVTDEIRADYEKNTTTKIRDAEGNLHEAYADRFYREPTPEEAERIEKRDVKDISYTSRDWKDGKGYRAKVRFILEGMKEEQVPYKEIMTLATFAEEWDGKRAVPFGSEPDLEDAHKYGYTLLDKDGEVVKIVNRTNPNSKWDWYQIGGRYSGRLKLKDGAVGERGTLSWMHRLNNAEYPEGCADQAYKGDIDFESKIAEARENAGKEYDRMVRLVGVDGELLPLELSWRDRPKDKDLDECRKLYRGQEAMKRIDEARGGKEISDDDKNFLFFSEYEEFLCGRDEYIERAGRNANSTFAVVKDGKWYERGEMGWWACVSNEKDQEDWNGEFASLLADVSDDTLLTIVDCHI